MRFCVVRRIEGVIICLGGGGGLLEGCEGC